MDKRRTTDNEASMGRLLGMALGRVVCPPGYAVHAQLANRHLRIVTTPSGRRVPFRI